jgi:hypothetical protein
MLREKKEGSGFPEAETRGARPRMKTPPRHLFAPKDGVGPRLSIVVFCNIDLAPAANPSLGVIARELPIWVLQWKNYAERCARFAFCSL